MLCECGDGGDTRDSSLTPITDMESFLDTQSLSTAASSSTPHTPSPSMNESTPVDYGYEPSPATVPGGGHYYFDYHHQHHQHNNSGQQHQHPQMLSMDISHPSATAAPLYRRASFPFVQHDHSMSHYPKYDPDPNDQPYQLEERPADAMVVPTQIPHHHLQQQQAQQGHPHAFYRPSSSSSSVSSVSAPTGFLNPAMSSIPVMHTDDAASKETQYLRRKCFNCGTTEPPSWRRSTLNPGKIVCNKCGLYERTHNKPRPHQFGLRPGNKTRKQPPTHHQHQHQHHLPSQTNGKVPSPSSSPKRHGLAVKKEQLDYSQAMRRGSIASINSGSGASDWDDHSGYSTASSAYHSSLGMGPPYNQLPPPPQPQHQHQHGHGHPLNHHGHGHGHSSHVPNHHGHHPYNSALSMPPPRSTSHGIRLPQAPPMKLPSAGDKAGSSSPIAGPGVTQGGGNNPNSNSHSHSTLPHIHTMATTGNGRTSRSPDNMSMLSPSALVGSVSGGSPYATPTHAGSHTATQGILSPSSNSTMPSSAMYSPASVLRGPQPPLPGSGTGTGPGPGPTPLALPTPDYYARRGSTSQIPQHHHASSLYHEDTMATMRRGSVGAIGIGASHSNMAYGGGARGLPPPSSWQQPHYRQSNATVPLSEMSLTPTPAPGGHGNPNASGSCNSAGSTPQQGYANVVPSATGGPGGAGDSPPHVMNNVLRGPGSSGSTSSASPVMPPEVTA